MFHLTLSSHLNPYFRLSLTFLKNRLHLMCLRFRLNPQFRLSL
jgi:hypothetical protein